MKTPVARFVVARLARAFALGAVAACCGLLSTRDAASADEPKPATSSSAGVSYYRDIRPILQANCHGCHQPAKAMGGLVATSLAGLLKGGESEHPAILAGKPDESPLVEQITPRDGRAEMPKDKEPLTPDQIQKIRQWIAEGASDDTPAAVLPTIDAEHPPVYEGLPVLTSLDFSPDDTLLALSGYHETLLYSGDGGQLLARLVGQAERIESVRFSPDGKWLAVTGGSPGRLGEVQVWNVADRKLALAAPLTYDTIYGASWSPDGAKIAFGCGDNTVRVIDATTGKQLLYQGAHNDWVQDTVFSKDGSHLVSVSRDRSMKLIEVATQRFVDNITSITPGALKGGLAAVDRNPQNDELLIGGADGTPKLYQMHRTKKREIGDDFNLIRAYDAMPGRINDAHFNADGSRFVVGSSLDGAGEVRVYETASGKLLQKMQGNFGPVYSVSYSRSGRAIASCGFDGIVRLHDAETGALSKEFSAVPTESLRPTTDTLKPRMKLAATTPAPPAAKEPLPAESAIVSLSIEPAAIDLKHRYDYAQLVVSGKLASGDTIDVTRMCEFASESPAIQVSATGVARPVADGQTKLKITLAGVSVDIPASVTGSGAAHQASFVRDVMPTMSKLGCNAGTCHGSLNGKNGFKLSLRGYDPLYDHRALTDDISGRRTSRAAPDQSLMLLKPSGVVPHAGGALTQSGEPAYEKIREWVSQGLRLDLDAPRVAKIEIFPQNPVVPLPGLTQQMRVLATYTNGDVRDVTLESFIETGNSEVAETNKWGLAKMARRGEAPILARYEGAYTATTITVMGDRAGFEWRQLPTVNYIDELVDAKLKRVKATPSDICTDAEFIRRVSIDLTGLPPSSDDVRAFLADHRDSQLKRGELVERLIGNPDFIDYWTNKWGDLLQVNRKFLGPEGAAALRGWIRRAVADNMPYDRFVYRILTASGSTMENPPAAYYKVLRTPEETMENTTQLFLAVRFNCNKCHDHPFERWTQNQYYHLSAYFARVKRETDPQNGDRKIGGTDVEAPKPLIEQIADADAGEVNHAGTGKVVPPHFPFNQRDADKETLSRREQLARWLTARENPYFAKSYVNRLWGYMFGRGIIDPIDDIRAGNPPTNPELLQRLTDEFIQSDFNVREILRAICKSRTYQMSIVANRWNEDDEINFSHALARRLPAEVLYDSVYRVTGAATKLPGMPSGARAAQIPDVGITLPSGFFEQFGRPPRESSCECERGSGVMLGPVMALVNGPTIADAVGDAGNALVQLTQNQHDDGSLVDELFMRILNRPAAPEEHAAAVEALRRPAAGDMNGLRNDLLVYEQALDQQQPAWEASLAPTDWTPLDPREMTSNSGATFTRNDDLSILVGGTNQKGAYTIVTQVDAANITGIRLEALTDPSLPNHGPGRPANGNFVLSEVKVTATSLADPSKSAPVVLRNPQADFSQDGLPVQNSIDNNPKSGWAVHPQGGKDHLAIYEVAPISGIEGPISLTFTMDQQYEGNDHQLGKFRLSITRSPAPHKLFGPPAELAPILAVAADQRSAEQKATLARAFRSRDPQWVRLNQIVEATSAQTANPRLTAVQDLAWALINSPAFLFNR